MSGNNEFYIGWSPEAPNSIAKHVRITVFILMVLMVAGAAIFSLQQKHFSTASFEFGQLTEIKGVYHQFPVPSLKVLGNHDAFGNASYITIPLLGYGKNGVEGLINDLEKDRNTGLDNKHVTFRGTLLYSDGKALLQVDKNDQPLVSIDGGNDTAPEIRELGTVELTGEVLDPKCYFGVMKPGQGKPHRDCAIRCIDGGISPVFYVHNEKGETNYFLILDENGKKMNHQLMDYIAEPIILTARAVQYNDWVILYTDRKSIKRTGGLSWFKSRDEAISCGPGK
jgi:hypothetical protein